MSHQKRLGILVGGGPAPGINSVIGAATIRAVLEGVEVLGIRDGFEWIMQGDIDHVAPLDHRRGEPHPLPRRLAHRHLARQPDQGPAAPRERGRSRCCGSTSTQLITIGGDDTAFSAMKLEEKAAGPHPRRARAEDDRQRPRPAGLRRHLRLPDRAPRRRRDRQEPDGRRQDHLALVLRDRDGPQGRATSRSASARPRARRSRSSPRSSRRRRSASRRIVDTLVGRDHQAPELRPPRRRRGHRRGRSCSSIDPRGPGAARGRRARRARPRPHRRGRTSARS